MRITVTLLIGLIGSFAANHCSLSADENVRTVRQEISKWDKNQDGKLTGAEREEFLKQKRKQAADADAAARAAKLKAKPPKLGRARPSLSPEDIGKPIAKGIPKNIEEAQ